MDKRKVNDSKRKQNKQFKKRRNQLHSRRITCTARKEKQEGKTYERHVGLTINASSKTQIKTQEQVVFDVFHITEETLKQYESIVSPFTPRPTFNNLIYDAK